MKRSAVTSLLALLLILPACSSSLQAQDAPASQPATTQPATTASAEDDFARTLDDLTQKAAAIKDLSAQFTQTKTTAVLRKPLVSQGQINVRGSQTRWITLSPRPSAMSTSTGEIHLYYPQQKVLEIYPLDRKLSELVASPLPPIAILRRYFDIAPATAELTGLSTTQEIEKPIHLRLTPRDEQIAEYVQRIDVLIDSTTGLALAMAMTNATDERTVVEFTQVTINPGLKDEDLQIQIPAGTRTVRPLEAGTAR